MLAVADQVTSGIKELTDIVNTSLCPAGGHAYTAYGIGSPINVEKWEDCGKICSTTNGCEYWTWYSKDDRRNPKGCFLKKRMSYMQKRSTAISGSKKCTSLDSLNPPVYKLMKSVSKYPYCEEPGYVPLDPINFTWKGCKIAAMVLGYSGDKISDTDKYGDSASNDFDNDRPAGCYQSSWGHPWSEARFYFNTARPYTAQRYDFGDKILCTRKDDNFCAYCGLGNGAKATRR